MELVQIVPNFAVIPTFSPKEFDPVDLEVYSSNINSSTVGSLWLTPPISMQCGFSYV